MGDRYPQTKDPTFQIQVPDPRNGRGPISSPSHPNYKNISVQADPRSPNIIDRRNTKSFQQGDTDFFKNLLANLDTGVVVHGPDTAIKIYNPKARALLGLNDEEMLGKKAIDPEWDFLREDGTSMPLDEYPVNLVMASKKPLKNYIAGINNPQEIQVIWVMLNAFPEFNPVGRVKQVVVTFWDITHLKIAEEALANRTKELAHANRQLKKEVSERHKIQQVLIRQQRQMGEELAYAAKIQQTLIPRSSPRIPSLRMAWRFNPCQQIGGDLFNYHRHGKDQLSCYMLDVCGHGVAAALIASTVAQFLQPGSDLIGELKTSPQPMVVLNNLEHCFPFDRFESFFSIIYLTLDCAKGNIIYSCGGHPPPIILGAGGGLQILKDHGPVIGVVGGKPFQQTAVQLKPGDKIILYSDGLLDYPDHRGIRFGKDRLYNLLERHALDPIQVLLDEIQLASKKFGRGVTPDDDVSIMALEYHPR